MKNNYSLSIIIPTLNEANNIIPLVNEIFKLKDSHLWEIIFVDDSSNDGSLEKIIEISKKFKNIKFIARKGERSLSRSCTDGFKMASKKFILVMDADLQHKPKYIPSLYEQITNDNLDIVIASRFLSKLSKINFGYLRRQISLLAVSIVNIVIDIKVTDPLSGFFIINRNYLFKFINKLNNKGFKILLEIIIKSSMRPKLREIPIDFDKRNKDQSKLNLNVVINFIHLLLIKMFSKKNY